MAKNIFTDEEVRELADVIRHWLPPKDVIYLAGPITGNPNYKEEFSIAQKEWEEYGWKVLNPALTECNSWTYKDYIDHGLMLLKTADAIAMLKGWENSKGAILEKTYAETIGLKIYYENEE